jgi:hypothetical protein
MIPGKFWWSHQAPWTWFGNCYTVLLQFKSNCIITNKIYHKEWTEVYFRAVKLFSDQPSKIHTHALQLQYVCCDTRNQITCTFKNTVLILLSQQYEINVFVCAQPSNKKTKFTVVYQMS